METNIKSEGIKFLSLKGAAYGFQHLLALFGSIVVTSATAGLSMPVCLFTGGLGTLVFHLVTKGKVPVFTGASTAFVGAIAGITFITNGAGESVLDISQRPYVGGAIIIAGLIYCVFAGFVYFVGIDKIKKWFPPVVCGPVIMIIGCKLAGKACTQASSCWIVALVTLFTVIAVNIFAKGFWKTIPFIFGVAAGYITALIYDGVTGAGLISFDALKAAPWIQPFWDFKSGEMFVLPKFNISVIIAIAPVALVTMMEHIGDITTNGAVCGKNFMEDPGLHRTLIGDGLSTAVAGLFGGNSTTTFSQNTGLLAITGVYDPVVMRVAAVFAMILALVGKVAGFVATIPTAVIGGISIILFGSVASVGARTMVEGKVDFKQPRNIMIVSVTMIIGLGMTAGIKVGKVTISSLALAVVAAVLMNIIFPGTSAAPKKEEK